jgi:uncharacterized membrane protein YfcA
VEYASQRVRGVTLLLGVIVGLVLGLTGAGGSVLAVPLFREVLHAPMDVAVGLSLGVVGIGALVGTLGRLRSGSILFLPGVTYAAVGSLTAPLGQLLGRVLPEALRLGAFALLVVWVATRMWREAANAPDRTRVVRAVATTQPGREGPACPLSPSGQLEMNPRCLSRLAAAGALTGVLSGLFGVGGGFVIVPSLVLLIGVDLERAVATSLFVITGVTASGFLTYLVGTGHPPWALLGQLALGSVIGMGLGTVFARWVSGPWLTRAFVVAMLAATALTFFNSMFAKGATI